MEARIDTDDAERLERENAAMAKQLDELRDRLRRSASAQNEMMRAEIAHLERELETGPKREPLRKGQQMGLW